MTTWAQLTPDEQALLDKLARALLAGDEWVDMGNHAVFIGDEPEVSLNECDLIRTRYSDYKINITAKGLLVWQQGQSASAPPRSVWVAEEGEYEDRHTLSIHTTEAGAKAACQRDWQRVVESHKDMDYPAALVWERDNWRDDIPGYYSQFGPYSVHQYSLVNDAE